ncbi:MAG: sugar ABC transporter permease YjfF [Oribacterium sp.]|jgi:simple sugar transport system permease protein|nr:sugar ABC transporter permease YjfF [Oribacterium sp.]MDY6307590.1 sugar ABC transporter permease YjfF [Oribacterium sp.]MDY6315635.1 sugar ABC transporter permease YjfF [Oribacterium sp.]
MNQKKAVRMNSNTILLLITIGLFIVMYAAGCIVYGSKGFSNTQTFMNILINNAGLICISCGMTCVMLTAGIDISVGSLVALDCMVLATGMQKGHGAIAMMLFVLVIGLLIGAFQGYCIGYLEIQPFIVTMAGMFFCRGMTAVVCREQVSITEDMNKLFYQMANLKFKLPFGGYYNKKGVYMAPYVRLGVIIALIVLVLVFLMLRYTRFGRSLYAIGGSEQSAAMMGLNVKKVKMQAYMLSSFLCSIGGICYCLNTMSGSVQQAQGLEMDAISSAVIGGTLLTGGVGNVIGTLFGVLINGTISSIVKTNGKLASSWPNILTAILLFLFIVIQSIFAIARSRKKA